MGKIGGGVGRLNESELADKAERSWVRSYTAGAGWAPFTLVREMFLACSRTLDFASTMEDVPAVVDLKRTRETFLDAAERCIILG